MSLGLDVGVFVLSSKFDPRHTSGDWQLSKAQKDIQGQVLYNILLLRPNDLFK